jgi:hypothetical protein
MTDRVRVFAASVLLVAAVVSCKKAEKKAGSTDPAVPAAVASGATPPAAQPDNAATAPSEPSEGQYAKAALSEDTIKSYIKSLGEGKNMFAPPGTATLDETKIWMDEQQAFAKKYGFKDGPDYMDTIGRIDLALMTVQSADQTAARRAALVKTIADSQASLSAADAETKVSLDERIADSKKQLVDMDVEAKSFNADDLALIKKFRTEIETAEAANQTAQKANKAKK